jgi:hypothetical protein
LIKFESGRAMAKHLGAAELLPASFVSTNAFAGLTGNVISASYNYPSVGTNDPEIGFSVDPFTVDGTVETIMGGFADRRFQLFQGIGLVASPV